jgi:excinuclease ABC subunit B
MQAAMEETARRREKQADFNQINRITPATIKKAIETSFDNLYSSMEKTGNGGKAALSKVAEEAAPWMLPPDKLARHIADLEREMRKLAKDLEFEQAAGLRDRIRALREHLLEARQ